MIYQAWCSPSGLETYKLVMNSIHPDSKFNGLNVKAVCSRVMCYAAWSKLHVMRAVLFPAAYRHQLFHRVLQPLHENATFHFIVVPGFRLAQIAFRNVDFFILRVSKGLSLHYKHA